MTVGARVALEARAFIEEHGLTPDDCYEAFEIPIRTYNDIDDFDEWVHWYTMGNGPHLSPAAEAEVRRLVGYTEARERFDAYHAQLAERIIEERGLAEEAAVCRTVRDVDKLCDQVDLLVSREGYELPEIDDARDLGWSPRCVGAGSCGRDVVSYEIREKLGLAGMRKAFAEAEKEAKLRDYYEYFYGVAPPSLAEQMARVGGEARLSSKAQELVDEHAVAFGGPTR